MASRNSGAILRQIHTLFTAGTCSGLSDRQLLERFVACRDAVSESAFAVLVQRHGPMVLSVCRRILADPYDAEDAFQATFLVLVRKARSIRVEGSVGRWLFGVAMRVAARARANGRRRRGRERSGLDRIEIETDPASSTAVDRAEIQSILAEELGRLPARFQAAVLLCDLEGSSHEEAARRLGWPVGTVKSRLSRARARLRGRLTRRGLGPEDLLITVPLLPAALPRSLVEAMTRAAGSLIACRVTSAGTVSASVTTLTEGVLRTMFLTKLKLVAAALLVIMTGSAVLVSQATAQKSPARPGIGDSPTAPTGATDGTAPRDEALDVELLERAWVDAIPRRDAAIIGRIMADDFEGIDPAGNIFTKATYMPDLRKGVFTTQPIELDEIKTRIFGETAVVTSRIKIQRFPTRGRMTNVYVKRQGRWQCVASHASGIAAGACPVTGTAPSVTIFDQLLGRGGSLPPRPVGQANDCASCHMVNPHTSGGMLPAQGARSRDAQSAQAELLDKFREYKTKLGMKRPDQVTRIRPRLACVVEKVHVNVGQTVKKGDPLVDLFSTDLAAAKNDYLTREVQWKHDQWYLRTRSELHAKKAISEQLFVETQNNEEKSKLQFQIARERVKVLGLDDKAIGRVSKEDGGQKARLTLRSPVDGTVMEVGAETGNLYDTKSVLIVIGANPSQQGPMP